MTAPAGLEEITRRLFAWRRKQLGNSLPAVVGGENQADHVAQLSGWPADWRRRRPEELAPDCYFALARVLETPSSPASPAG